jgi:hypothetical protein
MRSHARGERGRHKIAPAARLFQKTHSLVQQRPDGIRQGPNGVVQDEGVFPLKPRERCHEHCQNSVQKGFEVLARRLA